MISSKPFLLLLLIHEITCDNGFHIHLVAKLELSFIFCIISICYIFRFFLNKFNIPIPWEFFLAVVGCIWGVLAYFSTSGFLKSAPDYFNTHLLLHIYFPALIFYITFCIDVQVFLKTVPQILIVGVPVTLLTALVYGCLMRLIINPSWKFFDGVFFGIFVAPVYPTTIRNLLKQQSLRTRQLSVLLEGEAVFSLIIVQAVQNLFFHNRINFVVYPLQYFAVISCSFIFDVAGGLGLGFLARFLIRKMYSDKISVYILTIAMPFVTYTITKTYLSGFGALAVAIVGCIMSEERATLPKEINDFLTNLWSTLIICFDATVAMNFSVIFGSKVAINMNPQEYITGMVAYLLYYTTRLICFLIFSSILSRLGNGIDLKNMIVCVWGGIKNPFSNSLCQINYLTNQNVTKFREYYFHVMIIYILSVLINASLIRTILEFLGLTQISTARQLNMNNCLKYIFGKRDRMIKILKMDRLLCDANWSRVSEATNIRHPYQLDVNLNSDNDFFLGYHYTSCPECFKEIPREPTKTEFREMKKEAKMRVLKAKKMSYSRQYENGMISKQAIRLLNQAVDLAMDSQETIIKIEELQNKFVREGYCTRFVRNRVQEMDRSKGVGAVHRLPRKYFRRLCYKIVLNNKWERFMLVIVACHVILLGFNYFSLIKVSTSDLLRIHSNKNVFFIMTITLRVIFVLLYALEIVMKILAYSYFNIWKHGIPTYFKSIWHIIDFLVIIMCYTNLIYDITNIASNFEVGEHNITIGQVLCILSMIRAFRLFRIFEIFYSKFLRYIDRNVDLKMALTYELGKSYASGEAEILEMLPYVIDNNEIREEIKKKIESDRILVTKLLSDVQKKKPWVAITVKSKQAIRTILKSMREAINDLEKSGWVDTYEYKKIDHEMDQLYKHVNALKFVTPSAPKIIFKEVPWMADEKAVVDFLFENVKVKKFEPGDIVFEEGSVADGIYIIVTGLFMISYTPVKNVLQSLQKYGLLPIVDYLSESYYNEPSTDYIVSGNCVGELSFLTGRPYNCIITADAHSQVYVVQSGILRRAMELSPDPVLGLESRIWKEISIRIAVPILLSVPAYQSHSQDKIKYILEQSFVPNLKNYKTFSVNSLIQDIILIEGIVADYDTKDTFIAPSYIPRNVHKLILPNNSLLNIPITIETKLLIIPDSEADEYDIMIETEDSCEMVAKMYPSKCLQHTVKYRSKKRKRKIWKNLSKSSSTSMTNKLQESEENRSRSGTSDGNSISDRSRDKIVSHD